MAFDRQGQLLVSETNALHLWNLATAEEVRTIPQVAGGQIVFSADGRWLASNPQGRPKLWDANTWNPFELSPMPGGSIWTLAFAQTQLPASLFGSEVKSWQATAGQPPLLLGSTYAMALSPDKKLLALGHARGADVDIWDLSTSKKVTMLSPAQVSINRLEFSPDGKLLLTTGQETPITPAMIAAHQLNVQAAVKLWDVATWTPRTSVSLTGFGNGFGEFSPDSRWMAFNRSGLIEIFEIGSNKLVKRLASGEYPSGNMAFSPDGAWLVSYTPHGVNAWKLDATKPGTPGN